MAPFPSPESDTMKELILMQAIINAYGAPPKYDLAAEALKLTPSAVSGRYNRLKRKIEQAGVLFPLHAVGPDGQPIRRGRGRPPKVTKQASRASGKTKENLVDDDVDDDEDLPDATETCPKTTSGAKTGDAFVKTENEMEYVISDDGEEDQVLWT